MSDIEQRLRERATSYRQGGPSSEHTASILDEAADTIASLRSKLEEAEGALERMADTSEYYDGLGLLTYKPRMSADDMQSLAFRTLASLREADHA